MAQNDSSRPSGTSGNPVPSGLGTVPGDGINQSNLDHYSHGPISDVNNGVPGSQPGDDSASIQHGGSLSHTPLVDPPPDVEVETLSRRSPSPLGDSLEDTFTQMLAAYSLLSPDQQSKWRLLMGAPKSVLAPRGPTSQQAPSPSVIFSGEGELPAASLHGEHKFGIHPEVVRLAQNKQYLPLSLFLASSVCDLFLTTIPTHRLMHDGSKIHVINVDHFPDETKLDAAEWLEAWANYKRFLQQHAVDAVFRRWDSHFNFLSSQADFRSNFPAILRFDIQYRREYNARPFLHDEIQFLRDFQAVKDTLLREDLALWRKDLEGRTPSNSSAKSSRYEPYPASASGRTDSGGDGSGKTTSFPRGSGSTSSSAPICLICARTGHRYTECKESSSEQGKALFCKSVGRKLVSASSTSTVICVQWNLGGAKRCQRDHADLHLCSFCGSRAHFACARICL